MPPSPLFLFVLISVGLIIGLFLCAKMLILCASSKGKGMGNDTGKDMGKDEQQGQTPKAKTISTAAESNQQGLSCLWAGLDQLWRAAKSSVTSIKICISFYQVVTQARAISNASHAPSSYPTQSC